MNRGAIATGEHIWVYTEQVSFKAHLPGLGLGFSLVLGFGLGLGFGLALGSGLALGFVSRGAP